MTIFLCQAKHRLIRKIGLGQFVKPAIVASIVCLLLSAVLASGNLANQDNGEVVVVSVDSTNLRFSPETITLQEGDSVRFFWSCLLYTSPSPRDATLSRMPSSA